MLGDGRAYGSGDSQFGKTLTVSEPGIGGPPQRAGFAEVDMDDVGYLEARTSKPLADIFPRSREWCAYMRPIFQTLPTPGLVAPDITAIVEYGTGGANQRAEVKVPPYGVAMHVSAQYVTLSARIQNTGAILVPRTFELAGNVAPGSPRRTLYREYFYGVPGPVPSVDLVIPPFATDLSVVGSPGGQVTEQCDVQWRWAATPIGTVLGGPALAQQGCIPGGFVVTPLGAEVARVSLTSGAPINQLRVSWGCYQ